MSYDCRSLERQWIVVTCEAGTGRRVTQPLSSFPLSEHGLSAIVFTTMLSPFCQAWFLLPCPHWSLQKEHPWLFVCGLWLSFISWSWSNPRGNSFCSSTFTFPAHRWLYINSCLDPLSISALLRPSVETHQLICPEFSLSSYDLWFQRLPDLAQIPSPSCFPPSFLQTHLHLLQGARSYTERFIFFFHQSLFSSKKLL